MARPDAPERRQVLRGLALNRTPGWNFPGNFMEISFDSVGGGEARVSVEPGPHLVERDGQASLGALGVLADIGMAVAVRHQVGLAARMATVSMSLQFGEARRVGRLEAAGHFDGFRAGPESRHGLARVEIRGAEGLVATGSAAFVVFDRHDGTAPLPLRRRGVDPVPEPLRPGELNEAEGEVLARADRALRARGDASFIERFWGLVPRRTANGASCTFPNALHVGNRVGHTQGGLTFALAAVTGAAALGDPWSLVGASAWYTSPGVGPKLLARAKVVHQGTLVAVVETRITDTQGRTVLRAVTHHARR